MEAKPDLASSTYCLANKGKEYLVYLPDSLEVEINLDEVQALFSVEWFNPETGEFRNADPIEGGSEVRLRSPFDAIGAVLHLSLQ